jgi:hypothetical protein
MGQSTYLQNGTLDEASMRGSGQVNPSGYVPDATPMATNTYTNGNTFAGTGSRSNPGGGNVPMSDAAYRLISNNGTQAIPTDRDVLGGGKFGVRGWMNDHPVGVMAAFIAAAAGGAALAPGGAGGAAGGGAGGAAGEAGGITGFGGAGTGGMAGNLATDLAGVQMGGGAAGSLAASGGIQGGAGAFGGGLGQFASQYGSQLSNLGGNSGNSGGNSAPIMMPQTGFMGSPMQPPMNTSRQTIPLNQSRTRLQGYSRKPMQFGGSTIWV